MKQYTQDATTLLLLLILKKILSSRIFKKQKNTIIKLDLILSIKNIQEALLMPSGSVKISSTTKPFVLHFLISFDKFSKEHLHLYGECLVEKQSKVLNVQHFCAKISKKYPHHINSKIRMSGRFIFTNEIFPIISELIQKKSKQEITDVDALHKALNHNQLVKGLKIIGHTYDTGNPKSYVRANTAFFKKYVI